MNRIVVVAVAAFALWLVAPGIVSAAIPLLVVAACPLSMLFMVKMMADGVRQSQPPSPADIEPEIAALHGEVARLRATLAEKPDPAVGDVQP